MLFRKLNISEPDQLSLKMTPTIQCPHKLRLIHIILYICFVLYISLVLLICIITE